MRPKSEIVNHRMPCEICIDYLTDLYDGDASLHAVGSQREAGILFCVLLVVCLERFAQQSGTVDKGITHI